MEEAQLAEVNVTRLAYPLDDSRMSVFREAIARINLLAESSPGFVWWLSPAHVGGMDVDGGRVVVVNVSMWEDYESLHAFTYRGLHGRYLTERGRWVEPIPGHTTALWWLPTGEYPTVAEATARLRHLRAWGPTPRAFSVLHRFTPGGTLDRRAAVTGRGPTAIRPGRRQ